MARDARNAPPWMVAMGDQVKADHRENGSDCPPGVVLQVQIRAVEASAAETGVAMTAQVHGHLDNLVVHTAVACTLMAFVDDFNDKLLARIDAHRRDHGMDLDLASALALLDGATESGDSAYSVDLTRDDG